MAARQSLKANVAKPAPKDAGEAAKVAQQLAKNAPATPAQDDETDFETVSFNLPVDLIELVRDLADARVKTIRKMQRAAKKQPGGWQGPEARRSASAVVREALEAHREKIEAELGKLGG